jgi:arginyl-tRNA--protein-N-Asp/Glu arginylyltransferase
MTADEQNAVPPLSSFSLFPAIPPPVKVSLVTLGVHPCSYLPGRSSESRALWAEKMPASVYHRFMDAGFRRSGKVVYQPVCAGCRACMPIRVPVDTFQPSKSQRRCRRRNQDLKVAVAEPEPTDEKYDLYRRYVVGRHHRSADEEGRESFERFLYDSPVDTVEFTYRDFAGTLLAVGICDMSGQSLSSVYFYYDPADSRRGLGTFGALYEIETAARLEIPYYYLGYWVDGCASMQYKAEFRPAEVLWPDGAWRPT